MKTPKAFSLIKTHLFIRNEESFKGYMAAIGEHRNALLRGEAPAKLPTPVKPVYTVKAKQFLEAGLCEMRDAINALKSHQDIRSREISLSFSDDEFAWGYTPVHIKHTCGTEHVVRAYAIDRTLQTENKAILSCAHRECYQATTGIILAEGAVTPSRKGEHPANAKGADAIAEVISKESDGQLRLISEYYVDVKKPLLTEIINAQEGQPRYALFIHDNAVRRQGYIKAGERLSAGKTLHPKTPQFLNLDEALAYLRQD